MIFRSAPIWTPENLGRHDGRCLRYPSDLTDAEGALVQPFSLLIKHKAIPTPGRLREILNAVLSVRSTGCQWHARPKDVPPRSTMQGWIVRWPCDGVLDRLHFALSRQVRELEGRHAGPTSSLTRRA